MKDVGAFEQSDLVPADAGQDTVVLSKPLVVATREAPADWLSDVRSEIQQLLDLQENWDSYGAYRVDRESVQQALSVAAGLSWFVGIDQPTVTATPEGHVGFCWDSGHWSLDASIDSSGLISFVFLDREEPDRDRENRTRYVERLVEFLTSWWE